MPCYLSYLDDGTRAWLTGNLGPHCGDHECFDVAEYRCDWKTRDGRTCDALLCRAHAFEVREEVHCCPGHELLWRKRREQHATQEAREP